MRSKLGGIIFLLFVFLVQVTMSQEMTISGIVSDDFGPLTNVSIIIEGTELGTLTDFNGTHIRDKRIFYQ